MLNKISFKILCILHEIARDDLFTVVVEENTNGSLLLVLYSAY